MKRLATLLSLGMLIMFYQNCGDGFRPAELQDEFLQSIGGDDNGNGPGSPGDDINDGVTPPAGPTVAEKASAIFQAKCVSCHGPGSPNGASELGNITQLATSRYVVGQFPERSILVHHLTGQKSLMPPVQALSDLEIADVESWIDTIQRPLVIPTSFLLDVTPILTNRCTGCHNINNRAGQVRYDNHLVTLQTVTPGNAATSELSLTLIAAPGNPLMPPAGALPAAEIELINDWINEGALDN